jgi:uncharacterized membrane protein YqjE
MAGEFTRSRGGAEHAGIFGSALALVGALVGFVESRLTLFAAESKTALVRLAVAAICLVAAIMLLGFGYIFLIASAIVGLAHLWQISWLWTALIAAGLHFIVALVLLIIFRATLMKPMFRTTAAELKEDREWLRQIGTTKRRVS